MDSPKFSFFKSESKWLQSTSIAAYIICAATLLALFYSGWMAYGVMYSSDASGDTYLKGVVKDSKIKSSLPESNLEGVNVSIKDTESFTHTNSKGEYQFNKTPAGRLTLLFTQPGYRAVELKVLVAEASEKERVKVDTVSLVPFEKNKITTVLKTANLEGTVFSRISSSAVSEAVVSIQGSSMYYDTAGLQKIAALNLSQETGAQGTFQFTNLPIGILELHVKVYFNETYWRANHKVKIYESVTTFLPSEGNTTTMNISFDGSAWSGRTEDLKDPFTFVTKEDVRQQRSLSITLDPEERAKGTPFVICVYNQGTGVLVYQNENVASNAVVGLYEGIYMVTVNNMFCRMTVANNISVQENRSIALSVRYGNQPFKDDQTDDLGYYQCAIINLILAVVAGVGAFFCFTKKRYLVAMVGAMACVLSRSPFELIPGICNFNMILGIIAFLFIFRSRDKFLDAPPPLPALEDKAAPPSTPATKVKAPAVKSKPPTKGKPSDKTKEGTAIKGEAVKEDATLKAKKKPSSAKVKAKKD